MRDKVDSEAPELFRRDNELFDTAGEAVKSPSNDHLPERLLLNFWIPIETEGVTVPGLAGG